MHAIAAAAFRPLMVSSFAMLPPNFNFSVAQRKRRGEALSICGSKQNNIIINESSNSGWRLGNANQ
jgi:hypothetical protein